VMAWWSSLPSVSGCQRNLLGTGDPRQDLVPLLLSLLVLTASALPFLPGESWEFAGIDDPTRS
jgi:hypothetical protein